MKRKLRWWLLAALAVLVLVVVGAVVALRYVVDAESYRGLLQSTLEERLGRPVDFGEMDVSLWPVIGLRLDDLKIGRTPDERFDDPVQADSLRVGARLFPLLRGQLEVESLIVERPVISLYRRDDGGWEPTLPDTGNASDETEAGSSGLVIDRLRVTDGRLVLRGETGGKLREASLEQLSLRLDELGSPGGSVPFELSAKTGPSGEIDVDGTLGQSDDASDRPSSVEAHVDLEGIDPALIPELLAVVAPSVELPAGLPAGRPFGLSAEAEARLGDPAEIVLRDAKLRGVDLALERDKTGSWNLPASTTGAQRGAKEEPSAGGTTVFRAERLSLENASLRLSDPSAPGGPATTTLEVPRLTLDRLPTDGPATVELDARLGAGKIAVRGTLGPLADDVGDTPFDLSVSVEALPVAELRALIPAMDGLDVSRAAVAAELQLEGAYSRKLTVGGSLSLSGGKVAFAAPDGQTRTLPLELRARADVNVLDGAKRIELPKLDLELPRGAADRKLTLRGSLDLANASRYDVELVPTRVAADDLAMLAALVAPDAPLSFASPEPVELQLRARGVLGGKGMPDVEGHATLSGFSFRYSGMTQPMEQVGAKVEFAPKRITLDDLSGVIGQSDLTASRVVIADFDAPRVEVDLNSNNADFWELFSFVRTDEAPATPADTGDDTLSRLSVKGNIRIGKGSLQTLKFEDLSSGMDLAGGVLTLQPLEMKLYGGQFSGRLVHDLNSGVLTVDGDATDVEANDFLGDNLGLGGIVSGRTSADLDVKARDLSSENVLAGVSGGGPLKIQDGKLAKLDVLKSLSKAAGVFGESSLKQLAGKLSSGGTPFARAETKLGFDSGTLSFNDVLVDTPELSLAGHASLEAASGRLQGQFVVAFSPELSATMRAEHSRAADIFWDSSSQRVSFGFGVAGLTSAPEVKIDWEGAARGVAERKLRDRLQGLLGERGSPPATEAAQPLAPTPPVESESSAAPTSPEASAGGLIAEITATRWTGPLLLRDLTLEGTVRGANIDHASLTVTDSRGTEIQNVARLRPVDEQVAKLADPAAEVSLSWRAEIDGKRLALAHFPVKVMLTLYDREGHNVSTTREVNR